MLWFCCIFDEIDECTWCDFRNIFYFKSRLYVHSKKIHKYTFGMDIYVNICCCSNHNSKREWNEVEADHTIIYFFFFRFLQTNTFFLEEFKDQLLNYLTANFIADNNSTVHIFFTKLLLFCIMIYQEFSMQHTILLKQRAQFISLIIIIMCLNSKRNSHQLK